jgi:hypothetical protein
MSRLGALETSGKSQAGSLPAQPLRNFRVQQHPLHREGVLEEVALEEGVVALGVVEAAAGSYATRVTSIEISWIEVDRAERWTRFPVPNDAPVKG